MKQKEHALAIVAMISAILGLLSFLLFLFSNPDWTDTFIFLFLTFFVLTMFLGGISLFVQRTKMAWIAFSIGSVFVVLFLGMLLMLRDMCVVC